MPSPGEPLFSSSLGQTGSVLVKWGCNKKYRLHFFYCTSIFFKQQGCILHKDHKCLRKERSTLSSSPHFEEKNLKIHHFEGKKVCLLHPPKFTLWRKNIFLSKNAYGVIIYNSDIIFNLVLMIPWWCIKIRDCKRTVYNQKNWAGLFQCPQLVQPHCPWGLALLTVRLCELRKVSSWIAAFILPKNVSRCYWSSLPPSGGK